jgi:hypothetical protein
MRTLTILTISAICSLVAAADDKKDMKMMTGCLTKDATGQYTLESAGNRTPVRGTADLEKHSSNHKVTLHGSQKTTDGKTVFEVEKLEHVSDTCVAEPAR